MFKARENVCYIKFPSLSWLPCSIYKYIVFIYPNVTIKLTFTFFCNFYRTYRHIAYRRFVRWIWGFLGRKNRKILPSCAVNAIRNQFPSQQYSGFQYPA